MWTPQGVHLTIVSLLLIYEFKVESTWSPRLPVDECNLQMVQFWAASWHWNVEGDCGGSQSLLLWWFIGMETWEWAVIVRGGIFAHLATYPFLSLYLLPTPFPPFYPALIPSLRPMSEPGSGLKVLFWVGGDTKANMFKEVSNSDHFDCDFNFHHSIFYRSSKIANIIICILYIHKNVFTILIWTILICGFAYVVILFQSCKISIYIKVLCWFHIFTYLHCKQLSHSK
jgi:hypothetical protein